MLPIVNWIATFRLFTVDSSFPVVVFDINNM